MGYLFFSAECQSPSGYFIFKILNPIEQQFNDEFTKMYQERELESIAIIFICFEEGFFEPNNGFKERKYISRINRYADFRLKLDYIPFLQADEKKENKCSGT